MPGWSIEIANEFIRMGASSGETFTQMHLQELVYIAHGWCLALTGQPLTGDRPEALTHGPEYRRIAEAFIKCGTRPVTAQIAVRIAQSKSESDPIVVDDDIDENERAIMARVYAHYRHRRTSELAALTRADNTPWSAIYAEGLGRGRDIPHKLIRKQFAEIAAKSAP